MGEHTPTYKPPATPTRYSAVEKSPRPILKRKNTTGNPSLLGTARTIEQQIVSREPKSDMAASFLQFCAMCEKQIMTPCNSILYCSEACRRKDSVKPLTAAIITTTSTPISPPPSEPPSPRPVLSPRLPTGVSHTSRSSSSLSIPSELHDHSSDLDPTEWKPKLASRSSSDAFRYLSRFHHLSTTSISDLSQHTTGAQMPSLGNTPTTSNSSSLSTSAGLSPSRHGGIHNGYDFNTRPLPPRQNRWYSFNGGTPKGVDLVTPHVVPAMSTETGETGTTPVGPVLHSDEEGFRWEKRKVMFATPTKGDDGLSVLFADQK